ncbi:MAG TPA: hypothetical protein DCW68_03820 [Rhodospirillaceae bacterium]|nr:MAG: hypothetical protein A2018_07000 [Alphaproteobacteria bacterium GWF2_58_20]HAU29222.1 hypothetical protein [Rhodospirillaceae bacterium]
MSETTDQNKTGSAITDFTTALVRKLQGEHKLARAVQKELVAIARNNQASQRLVHQAVLTLLDSRDFNDAVDIVTRSFPTIFGCESVRICIEGCEISAWPMDVMLMPPGHILSSLGESGIQLCARSDGDPALFGKDGTQITSHALIRIDLGELAPGALLAFGSREEGKFQPTQSADLLVFLARVVEKCLKNHLR